MKVKPYLSVSALAIICIYINSCVFMERMDRIIVENRINCTSLRLGLMFFDNDTTHEIDWGSPRFDFASMDNSGWGPFDSKKPWPEVFEKQHVDSVYFYLVNTDSLNHYGWPKLWKKRQYLDFKVIKVNDLLGPMNRKIISHNTKCE